MSREATDLVMNLTAVEQAEYRAASTPTWAPTDSDTADLLDLLAEEHPATPSEAAEWPFFLDVLRNVAAEHGGRIDQNATRPLLHGQVAAPRVGAFFNRAARRGLIRRDGYTETTNSQSGNVGRPAPAYRWLGTQGGESNAR